MVGQYRGLSMLPRISQWRWSYSIVLLLICILLGHGEIQAQSAPDEYLLKAAFLYHFAQLVTWPPGRFSDPSTPFVLCTVGRDPFGGRLESTIGGKQVNSRPIHIRHVDPAGMHDCTMLFVGQSENAHLRALLVSLGNAPILTVGEGDGFLEAGGMIQFLLERNRIRFAINRGAAEAANLTISSQLLLLARNVIEPKAGRR